MGWYDVATAIREGDEGELKRALAQEEDPERTLMVAKRKLEEEQKHVPDDICYCPIHEGHTNEKILSQG
jgi:hypothetical protein